MNEIKNRAGDNWPTLIGKRLVLVFFNPDVDEADILGPALTTIAGQSAGFNFSVVGIAIGSTAAKARAMSSSIP